MHDARDLPEHLEAVGVHDGDAPDRGARLEGLHEQRLAGLELHLGVLVLRQLGGVVDLLPARLLPHLPQDLGHLARDLGGAAEDDGGVAGLEDAGVLLHGDDGGEGLDGLEVAVLLDVDDVAGVDLLVLGDALDGEAHGVARAGLVEGLLVLLDGEDLLVAQAAGDDADDVAREEGALLHGAADDLAHALDVVDVGDGQADGQGGLVLGRHDEVVEGLHDGEACDLLLGVDVGRPALVPGGLVRLVHQVKGVNI